MPTTYFQRAAEVFGDCVIGASSESADYIKTLTGVNDQKSAYKQLSNDEKDLLVLRLLLDFSADGKLKALRLLLRQHY